MRVSSHTISLIALALLIAGCERMHDNRDFERHANSRISNPIGGGDYVWFDVKLTPSLPLENELAEQQRLIWLQSWLKGRHLCPAGHEVVERRPFEFLEHNPEHMDLRYKVRCLVADPDGNG